MDAILRLDRVSKRYGSQVALDDVSFEVPPGVVFALLGENGAGKTTAIRVLLGLVDADKGQADVLGLDSRGDGLEIRRRIGYVSEQPAMYDWMTVDEIGWFAAGFYGDGYLDAFRHHAGQFHLPMRKTIRSLSKGMRAKVALSLALANDPEFLILDEPTSGLDPLVRREFLESMVDRAADGKSVLLSSHQIGEVERVADQVAILHRGRIALVAALDDLKSNVREITITLHDDQQAPPAVTGEILRQQRRARQWQLLVRDASDESLDHLRGEGQVELVETRQPTLEEIFVAYVTPGKDRAAEAPAAEEVPS